MKLKDFIGREGEDFMNISKGGQVLYTDNHVILDNCELDIELKNPKGMVLSIQNNRLKISPFLIGIEAKVDKITILRANGFTMLNVYCNANMEKNIILDILDIKSFRLECIYESFVGLRNKIVVDDKLTNIESLLKVINELLDSKK